MSYLPPAAGPPIDRETLDALARVAGLDIPAEDFDALGTALRDQLAAMAMLEALDLTDVTPIVTFDPHWHE
ncbi:MAG: hypothetical protein M3Z66_10500 [Chloroflexota bacterium]|nr:hypothetical protein [Chloroflexota bacterium]